MNKISISNNTGVDSTVVPEDVSGGNSTGANTNLIGFTFSDEACSEIRVVDLCSINPDRFLIGELVSGHEVGKRW
jgi:hypothetical protein